MKFAFYAYLYQYISETGVEKTAQLAKELGFTGLELLAVSDPLYNVVPDVKTAGEIRAVTDGYDLPFVCFSYPCTLTRENILERAFDKLEISKALGAPYFHHTMILEDMPDDPSLFLKLADVAEKIANYAKELDITVLYEPQGYCVNGIVNYSLFYDEMKKRCDNIGVCADFGNTLFVGEQPAAIIKKYASDIKHVHLKDYLYKPCGSFDPGDGWYRLPNGDMLRDTLVGHGAVNYEDAVKVLKDIGYEGYYSLEIQQPEASFKDGVKQAMDYTERIYNAV